MRLWNKNFLILWQGQFVSAIGSALYSIALGFFILDLTGSTAVMGSTMAITAIPRIFLSPLAGTFVDRHDRKLILIISDLVDGLSIISLGIVAYLGIVEIWMVVLVGVLTSVTGVFFQPAILSSLPDIVHEEKLIQANSALSLNSTSANIIGKLIGGFLFSILGAPIIFMINGLSFLFSASSELFISIPKGKNENKRNTFYHDLKDGFRYFMSNKGLKYLYILIAPLNLFGVMTMTLLLPLFNNADHLGPAAYGIAMTGMTAGMFSSHSVASSKFITRISRKNLFLLSGFLSSGSMVVLSLTSWLPLMILMMFLSGFSIALTNTVIAVALQTAIPADKRGRVSGFRRVLTSLLVPVGMTSAGVLAEVIHIPLIILVCNVCLLAIFIISARIPIIRNFINGIQEEKSVA